MSNTIYNNNNSLQEALRLLRDKATPAGSDTSDATASAEAILDGEIAYNAEGRVVGTMPNHGEINITFDGINTTSTTLDAGYINGGVVGLDDTINTELGEQAELITQLLSEIDHLTTADKASKPTLFTPGVSFNNTTSTLTITDTANGNFSEGYNLYTMDGSQITTLPSKTNILSQYITLNKTTEYKITAKSKMFNESDYSSTFVWYYYETLDGTPGLSYTIDGSVAYCTGVGSSLSPDITVASEYEGVQVTQLRNFKYVDSIEKLILPSSVSYIGRSSNSALAFCDNLTEVVLHYPGVVSLGMYSFRENDKLKTIRFNGGISRYDDSSFTNRNIENVYFATLNGLCSCSLSDTGGYYSDAWYNAKIWIDDALVTEVTHVNTTGNCCLMSYKYLQSVDSGSLTSLHKYEYKNCSRLTTAIIRKTIKSIPEGTFASCKQLQRVDLSTHTAVPTLSSTNALSSAHTNLQIKVNADLIEDWKAATNWSTFADKIVVEFTNEIETAEV